MLTMNVMTFFIVCDGLAVGFMAYDFLSTFKVKFKGIIKTT